MPNPCVFRHDRQDRKHKRKFEPDPYRIINATEDTLINLVSDVRESLDMNSPSLPNIVSAGKQLFETILYSAWTRTDDSTAVEQDKQKLPDRKDRKGIFINYSYATPDFPVELFNLKDGVSFGVKYACVNIACEIGDNNASKEKIKRKVKKVCFIDGSGIINKSVKDDDKNDNIHNGDFEQLKNTIKNSFEATIDNDENFIVFDVNDMSINIGLGCQRAPIETDIIVYAGHIRYKRDAGICGAYIPLDNNGTECRIEDVMRNFKGTDKDEQVPLIILCGCGPDYMYDGGDELRHDAARRLITENIARAVISAAQPVLLNQAPMFIEEFIKRLAENNGKNTVPEILRQTREYVVSEKKPYLNEAFIFRYFGLPNMRIQARNKHIFRKKFLDKKFLIPFSAVLLTIVLAVTYSIMIYGSHNADASESVHNDLTNIQDTLESITETDLSDTYQNLLTSTTSETSKSTDLTTTTTTAKATTAAKVTTTELISTETKSPKLAQNVPQQGAIKEPVTTQPTIGESQPKTTAPPPKGKSDDVTSTTPTTTAAPPTTTIPTTTTEATTTAEPTIPPTTTTTETQPPLLSDPSINKSLSSAAKDGNIKITVDNMQDILWISVFITVDGQISEPPKNDKTELNGNVFTAHWLTPQTNDENATKIEVFLVNKDTTNTNIYLACKNNCIDKIEWNVADLPEKIN